MKTYPIISLFMLVLWTEPGLCSSGMVTKGAPAEPSGPVLLTGSAAGVFQACTQAEPLQMIYLAGAEGNAVSVYDGAGKEYFHPNNQSYSYLVYLPKLFLQQFQVCFSPIPLRTL